MWEWKVVVVRKVFSNIDKIFDSTWYSVEVILDVVSIYVLNTQEKIVIKERKHQINDIDKPINE